MDETYERSDYHDRLTDILEKDFIEQALKFDKVGQALEDGITSKHFTDPTLRKLWETLTTVHATQGDDYANLIGAICLLKEKESLSQVEMDFICGLDDSPTGTSGLMFTESVDRLRKQCENRIFSNKVELAAKYAKEGKCKLALKLSKAAVERLEQSGVSAKSEPFEQIADLWNSEIEFAKPTLGAFGDGKALFYENSTNYLFGPRGLGKTWVSLFIIAEALRKDSYVVFIDPESTAKRSLCRLKYLGVTPKIGIEYFKYLATTDPAKIAEVQAWAKNKERVLVVYDGLANAIASAGKEENSNAALTILQQHVKPFVDTGATVLVIDHTGKDETKGARGHSSKEGFFKGACYQLKNGKSFSRGKAGYLKIVLAKDNEGGTGAMQGQTVALLKADIDERGETHFSLAPATDADEPTKGAKCKMSDDEILEALPVGEDHAMNFASISPKLNKTAFTKRCREIDGVHVEPRTASSGQNPNYFWRDPSK